MIKRYAVAYAMFVGFTVLTAVVVRPLVVKADIPLLKDIL